MCTDFVFFTKTYQVADQAGSRYTALPLLTTVLFGVLNYESAACCLMVECLYCISETHVLIRCSDPNTLKVHTWYR